MPDFDREEYDEEQERREYRHHRRVRNQIIAYVTTAVVFTGIIVGAGMGIHHGISKMNDKKAAAELQAQLEAMSASENEEVVVEAPMESTDPQAGDLSPLDELVNARISEMPLEDKVAGLFIVTPESLTGTNQVTRAGDTTKNKLTQYAVGGLVYAAQNISSADQLKEMLTNTNNFSKYPLFMALTEEGGSSSLLAGKGLVEKVGSAAEIAATGDTANAQAAGSTISAYLSEYGFNLDFAPVAGITGENTDMGDRVYGSSAGEVSGYVAAMVGGLQENNKVSAALKYFPEAGASSSNNQGEMLVSSKTREEYDASEFMVFQAGIDAGADFVMLSNLSAPAITGDNTPSSLSDQMIRILREDLSFQGIILTDDFSQGAITEYYTPQEAAVKAIQAGADMILTPEDFEAAYQGVLDAVSAGTLSEDRINESLVRIYRVKYRDKVGE